MKRLFLAAMIIGASVFTAAAKSVVFTLQNGTLVYYLLSSDASPVLKFVEGGVTVNADGYTFSQIKNFYISTTDDPNAIDEVAADVEATFKPNMLVLNAADVKSVKVFGASGAEVEANVSEAGDRVVVDLSNLAKGVYVISTGNTSFKMLKK